MHKIYDDYIEFTTNDILKITNALIDRIEYVKKCRYAAPFFVKVDSEYVFDKIIDRYTIKNSNRVELEDISDNEMNLEFTIKF